MKEFIFAVIGMAAVILVLFFGNALFPESDEAPDSNPTDDIHSVHNTIKTLTEELEADRRDNPTRYKHEIQKEREITFFGEITVIDESRLQFHIKKTPLPFDKYAECEFENEGKLNDERINIGGIVTVKGKVTELPLQQQKQILKLTSCNILEFR